MLQAVKTFIVHKRVLTTLRAPVFLNSLTRKKRAEHPPRVPPITKHKYDARFRNLTWAPNNVIARKRIRK